MGTPSQSSPLDLDQFEGFTPELVRHAARAIEDGPFWSTGDMASTAATRDLVLAAPALLAECKRLRERERAQRAEIERLRAALLSLYEAARWNDLSKEMVTGGKHLAAARAALGEAE